MHIRRISVAKYPYPYPFKQGNYYPYPIRIRENCGYPQNIYPRIHIRASLAGAPASVCRMLLGYCVNLVGRNIKFCLPFSAVIILRLATVT